MFAACNRRFVFALGVGDSLRIAAAVKRPNQKEGHVTLSHLADADIVGLRGRVLEVFHANAMIAIQTLNSPVSGLPMFRQSFAVELRNTVRIERVIEHEDLSDCVRPGCLARRLELLLRDEVRFQGKFWLTNCTAMAADASAF